MTSNLPDAASYASLVKSLVTDWHGKRESGGLGSGDYGHDGRPGHIGGSAPSGGTKTKTMAPADSETTRKAFIQDCYAKAKSNKVVIGGNTSADAVEDYQGGSWTVNAALRKGKVTGQAKLIDAALQPTPAAMEVYRGVPGKIFGITKFDAIDVEDMAIDRGVSTSQLCKELSGKVMAKIGAKTFTDRAFVSTSTKSAVAKAFSSDNGVVMKIYVPKGTKAFAYKSGNLNEHELLVNRGVKFKITGVTAKLDLANDMVRYEISATVVP